MAMISRFASSDVSANLSSLNTGMWLRKSIYFTGVLDLSIERALVVNRWLGALEPGHCQQSEAKRGDIAIRIIKAVMETPAFSRF